MRGRCVRFLLIIAVVLTASLTLPAVNAQSVPVSLPRIGPWELNYDADSCHLRAAFGSGDQKILMDLTRVSPSDSFDLTLYGKKLESNELNVDVEFAFGDQSKLQKRSALAGQSTVGEKLPLLIMSGLRVDNRTRGAPGPLPIPDITPADEAAVTALTIKLSSRRHYRLETGSLAGPFNAMRKCTDDLVVSWGYDPAVIAKLTKGPVLGDFDSNVLTSSDYPKTALAKGQSGRITFRLDVDASGKATGCHVLYRVAGDEFAKLTCALIMKRVKLTPALDQFGKPTKSYYIRTVNWLMNA